MDLCLGCIVEGQGESSALPILLRRIGAEVDVSIRIQTIIARHSRHLLIRAGELERAIQAISYRLPPKSGILVLLDADDDLSCELGPALLRRARDVRPDVRTRVVLATKEYEAWFLAAAASLAGKCGLQPNLAPPQEPESIRDAKHWLTREMQAGQIYSPTRHQPALTAQFDFNAARSAKSFDKFYRDVQSMILELKVAP